MTVQPHKETLEFQAEVSQILDLVIRSLYSNKEIFLRELVSNASDAAEKLRFEALADDALYEDDANLRIRVKVDKEAGTLTVTDNGIGMSRQEVVDNIGSIASSGTRKFLAQLTGDQTRDSRLIGQFGVGFYSAFIVADRISLRSRRAGLGREHGVLWESAGQGSYTLETVDRPERGTEITLHLKDDEKEFLDAWRLRGVIAKFSDHIALPIEMEKETGGEEGSDKGEYEQINQGAALWMRNKNEIEEQEYHEFYRHLSHDFDEPLAYVHNRVEGTNEYTALLFIPRRAPWDLWDREQRHGVKLYVRRVFVLDEADKLIPRYLRFVKGLVDSDDLPLNVSRELLQHNRKIDTIRHANTKRVLGMLEKMAQEEPDKYKQFWGEFGRVLKEGPAEDSANRERIAALLRFSSTHSDGEGESVSLDDYIDRMREGQEKIFFLAAETAETARRSPQLEVFRKKGIEVLLMSDRVDEWLVSHLSEFKGKRLQSVTKGELDLGQLADQDESAEKGGADEGGRKLLERIKAVLGEQVKEVRVSRRLVDSPACLVIGEYDMSPHLARVLKAAGQDVPVAQPTLEINLDHPLVTRLQHEGDEDRFEQLSRILLDQARLAEGWQLEDPSGFVQRVNQILLDLMGTGNDSAKPV